MERQALHEPDLTPERAKKTRTRTRKQLPPTDANNGTQTTQQTQLVMKQSTPSISLTCPNLGVCLKNQTKCKNTPYTMHEIQNL